MEGKLFASALKTLTPRFKLKTTPSIENFAFKLHYQATVTLLVTFVILVCSREFFGEHIRCISDQAVPDKVIETYCFFMATFTIVRYYNESMLQSGIIPHPGVGPLRDGDETIRHTYYQWVPFVLFLQSLAFYMPHYIWKKKEGGRIKALVDGIQRVSMVKEGKDDLKVKDKTVVLSKKTLENKLEIIRKDIILRLRISKTWSTWMVSMEVVNMLHVILQIYIVNRFLNDQFLDLGPKVIGFANWKYVADPLEVVFPKVTKCTFHKYGSGGSMQQHDALCIMALNIIHEKIYIVLWFWFLILFIVSVLAIVWRMISYCLYHRSNKFNEIMFRHVARGKMDRNEVFNVVNRCQYSDWLFLYYLAKNMQGLIFRELFSRLAEELQKADGYDQKGTNTDAGNVGYEDETLPLKYKAPS